MTPKQMEEGLGELHTTMGAAMDSMQRAIGLSRFDTLGVWDTAEILHINGTDDPPIAGVEMRYRPNGTSCTVVLNAEETAQIDAILTTARRRTLADVLAGLEKFGHIFTIEE
jgi:hypothetical protein